MLSGLLFLALPESPRWLQARGRAAQAEAGCAAFERSRVLRRRGATPRASRRRDRGDAAAPFAGRRWPWVAGLFLLSPWATVAFPLLTGAVLTQRGFKLDAALLIFGLSSLGPLLGNLAASTILDRIDRRLAMGACALAMLVCGIAFIFGSGTT